jgi:hypothetical protein
MFKPVLLSKLLGMGSIRPPKDDVKPPDLRELASRVPKAGPDGKPWQAVPADLKAVEEARPPTHALAACHESKSHWHKGDEPLFHAGKAWGGGDAEGWLWLQKSGKDWWAWTAESQPTWLWHQGHWWWKSDGVWFLLHEGEAWGYRTFSERRQEGLIHPGTGTQMVYSADGDRVALITPGDGAWLFDAHSGEVLDRWTEAQMPAKPKPHAPKSLVLPP